MPDITMCVNDKCPMRKICLRHRDSGVNPSDHQSWSRFKYNKDKEQSANTL